MIIEKNAMMFKLCYMIFNHLPTKYEGQVSKFAIVMK